MLEGKLVRLRGFRAADREVFLARDRDAAAIDVDAPLDYVWGDDDAERFIGAFTTEPNERYHLVIERLSDLAIVGRCVLWTQTLPHRYGSFGIYVFDGERGSGLGADAIETLLRFGFRALRLHRIGLDVRASNPARSLYRRLGFVEEAVLREKVVVDGAFEDEVLMGMLRREWEARP